LCHHWPLMFKKILKEKKLAKVCRSQVEAIPNTRVNPPPHTHTHIRTLAYCVISYFKIAYCVRLFDLANVIPFNNKFKSLSIFVSKKKIILIQFCSCSGTTIFPCIIFVCWIVFKFTITTTCVSVLFKHYF